MTESLIPEQHNTLRDVMIQFLAEESKFVPGLFWFLLANPIPAMMMTTVV